jgi:hypothetical protein
MNFQVHHRKQCRFCGTSGLVQYYEMARQPMTDNFLTAEQLGQEFVYPLQVFYCPQCWISQTQHDVDLQGYYNDYQYSVATSGFAQTFMRLLAEETWRRYGYRAGDTVVEVGSSDGSQLGHFRDLGARVFGFEPSLPLAQISRERGIPVAQTLFDENAGREIPSELLPVQVLLLTYTFDHLPEPKGFLRAVSQVLDRERGVLIIEVHDLEKILERCEFCLLEHEHTSYYVAATLQKTLAEAGLRMLDVGLLPESQRRGNSLLVTATPEGSALASRALPTLPLGAFGSSAIYAAFGNRMQASLSKLRNQIQSSKAQGKRVAGYGAGGRGVITLAAAAEPGEVAYLIDKNTAFHGLHTPVSHVPVDGPERLRREPVDEVVVFSFGYFKEISEELADVQAKGTRLISLLDVL